MEDVKPPENSASWLGLSEHPPQRRKQAVRSLNHIDAVVTCSGVARNHSEGRERNLLEYEAYEGQVIRNGTYVDEARSRWPTIGRSL